MKAAWLSLALLTATGAAFGTQASGESSLVETAESGRTAAAIALLAQGTDVNAPSKDGTTALCGPRTGTTARCSRLC